MSRTSPQSSHAVAPAYRWFDSLRDRNFRLLLGSNLLIYLSNMMEMVVLGWLILDITNSVWSVTLGAFLRFGPVLPMSLLVGTLADRFDRRKLLLFNLAGDMATVGAMALLVSLGSIELWQIYAIAPLRGIFNAVEQPLRRTVAMDMMGQQRITNALSLDASLMMAASIIGPFVSGRLIDTLGPKGSYITIFVLYGLGMILLSILRTPPRTSRLSSDSIVKNIVEGLRYTITHPVILPTLVITFIMNLLGFPFRQVLPVFARDIYGVSATGLGLLSSLIGVGAFLGSIVLAGFGTRFMKSRIYIWGSVLMAGAIIFFSLSGHYYLSLLILFFHGFGFAGFHIMQGAIPLSAAAEDKRGRVMGATQLAIGGGPIGTLLVGGLASALGPQMAVGIMASVLTLSILAIALSASTLRKY